MQKRPRKTEKKIDGRAAIRYPATCLTFVGKYWALRYYVDIHSFPLSSKYLQVTPTYFSLVTASSGPIYWSTEILYVNSVFSRLAFTIPRNVGDDFTVSINDSFRF